MKRLLLLLSSTLLAVTMIASVAAAQINLSWADCGSTGTADATFACASNVGVSTLVCSAVPTADVPHALGCEIVVDMIEANAALQPWWELDGTGCRTGGFNANADFTAGPFTCTDFWGGTALVVSGAVTNGATKGPNTVRFKAAVAFPGSDAPMTNGTEYYIVKFNILHTKSTGTGNCAGCTDPACFVLNSILVAQPSTLNDNRLLTGAATGGRDFATWQGGGGANCATVPTRNRTWGQMKSLYR